MRKGFSQHRTLFALLALCTLCASVNLTKAVHIDDTAYLEMALAILDNPFRPMSGSVLWHDSARPIHELNQPPLWPYAMALVMRTFGQSELALHGLMALVSGTVVFLMFAIARRLAATQALFVTALLVLGPVFLPGQDLMVDVPLLALWLLAFFALLRAHAQRKGLWYGVSAAAIAAACLVKYTSLVLIPVFIGLLLFRRDRATLRFVWIPLLTLGAWSAFNYLEYGGVHLLQRQLDPWPGTFAHRVLEWLAGLGSIATFVLAYLPTDRGTRRRLYRTAGGIGICVALISLSGRHCPWQLALLWGVFTGNGVLTLYLAVRAAWRLMTESSEQAGDPRPETTLLLLVWLSTAMGFVVLFAPFIAIRHVLMAVPPILLLLMMGSEQAPARRRAVTLVLTATLGFLLALSDYQQADIYRQQASRIRRQLPAHATIWFSGHWGWQWYARKHGMVSYDAESPRLNDGDFFVVPELAHQQRIPDRALRRLHPQQRVRVPAGPSTWLRMMSAEPWGGYYAYWFRLRSTPWRLSTAPLEGFSIFRVGPPSLVSRRILDSSTAD